jgi:hypothetical protein
LHSISIKKSGDCRPETIAVARARNFPSGKELGVIFELILLSGS